jgi:Fur family ferric uptake transcriptional regulator
MATTMPPEAVPLQLDKRLRGRGWRLTTQRAIAARRLADRPARAFTATALAEELGAYGVSRSSVYRLLERLVQLQVLGRVPMDGRRGYIVCDQAQHHHHLRCTGCGTVVCVASTALELAIQQLAEQRRFQLRGHAVEVSGRCVACTRVA